MANKQKQLEWAVQYLHEAENGFENVIWMEETTVQLEPTADFVAGKLANVHAANHGSYYISKPR